MLRATSVIAAQAWHAAAADTVVLDFDDRHRRRMTMTGTRGLEFLLDLPEAVALRSGDALQLDDGRLIEVVAAAEPLIEIRCSEPLHLVRVAWHLGNRHLPVQIMPRGLRIRRDHVIEEMVQGLGARVTEIEAPFDPEGGAYVSAPAGTAEHHEHAGHDHAGHGHHDHAHHGHGHHDHGHGHGHAHDHKHGHDHHDHEHHDHGHHHAHGESCGCGHDHDHAHDHDHQHDHDHHHGHAPHRHGS
jgi:urease accessory protein